MQSGQCGAEEDADFLDTGANELLGSVTFSSDAFDLDTMFPPSEVLDDVSSLRVDPPVALESSHNLTSRNKSRRLDTVGVLKQWLNRHSDNPYPTKQEKASLAQETGLTVTQVSTWFANAWRRWKRGSSSSTMSIPKSIDSRPSMEYRTMEWMSCLEPTGPVGELSSGIIGILRSTHTHTHTVSDKEGSCKGFVA
ncbi:hypothetical protein BO78DRAFT_418836 [Aspergillus sclerotiicarbonarius CBS 121057]|uniref:Homeobox domain-containing protein n=1 Tax=Aspergillus sclerotiicarbonarius (strain CBS 121057 / IBT 28362) TaxID=1448318 RepID=A0A319E7Y0_ASPSB|nr:hypothetical protein BO78DRAFT_418836 [Aspergillus sclerotiicarbonarius CBS 121057]